MGLPPLSEGVAHALGPWWWIKDSTLWIFCIFHDEVCSEGSYTKELSARRCPTEEHCAKGLYNIW